MFVKIKSKKLIMRLHYDYIKQMFCGSRPVYFNNCLYIMINHRVALSYASKKYKIHLKNYIEKIL